MLLHRLPVLLPLLAAPLLAGTMLAGSAHAVPPARTQAAGPPAAPPGPADAIIAVVNGDAITSGDVDNRARLFAVSTGLSLAPDVIARLRPQIIRQLINERLELQEMERRKVVVPDEDIAHAIASIEQRNNMPTDTLRKTLAGQGIALRTLIDEVRVQLGWVRVLREELGTKAEISDADVNDQVQRLKQERGQPEYEVGEIFIPVEDPAKEADAQRFADAVIAQLRAGAPFPVIAAQFSQSQTALQGGDLGWTHGSQLDPAVADLLAQMPQGAISNPVQVPGGIDIVTLRGKREVGNDMQTLVDLRQIFLPFTQDLNPQAPTDQQKQALAKAQQLSRTVKSCPEMEQAAPGAGSSRPPNPGAVKLEAVSSPPLRELLASQPLNQASKPIVSTDGIAILMICARTQKNAGDPSRDEVRSQLLEQRVELSSRQLLRTLRRKAMLDDRSSS
jgi:peptidyl-prolyl cis-trans isomerase SurA